MTPSVPHDSARRYAAASEIGGWNSVSTDGADRAECTRRIQLEFFVIFLNNWPIDGVAIRRINESARQVQSANVSSYRPASDELRK